MSGDDLPRLPGRHRPNDPKMLGLWKLGRTIGTGSSGKKPTTYTGITISIWLTFLLYLGISGRVRIARHAKTGQNAAIKIISKSTFGSRVSSIPKVAEQIEQSQLAIEREIVVMKLVSHPNIMRLYDVWETSTELYLILEYVQGGELFDHLCRQGRLSTEESLRYFQQVIAAIDYCHRLNICHRDLKPENILLDKDWNVKIADFGMAAWLANSRGGFLDTSCGSPHYAAPEVIAGTPYQGAASDIWSCGVILHALLAGKLPFDDDDCVILLDKVVRGAFDMPKDIEPSAQDLISKMLTIDVSKRIKMSEILTHPFFNLKTPKDIREIAPSLSDIAKPVKIASIDQDILANLHTLWDGSSDEDLIENLINDKQTWQKGVYHLLTEFRWRCSDSNAQEAEDITRIRVQLRKRRLEERRYKRERDAAVALADNCAGQIPTMSPSTSSLPPRAEPPTPRRASRQIGQFLEPSTDENPITDIRAPVSTIGSSVILSPPAVNLSLLSPLLDALGLGASAGSDPHKEEVQTFFQNLVDCLSAFQARDDLPIPLKADRNGTPNVGLNNQILRLQFQNLNLEHGSVLTAEGKQEEESVGCSSSKETITHTSTRPVPRRSGLSQPPLMTDTDNGQSDHEYRTGRGTRPLSVRQKTRPLPTIIDASPDKENQDGQLSTGAGGHRSHSRSHQRHPRGSFGPKIQDGIRMTGPSVLQNRKIHLVEPSGKRHLGREKARPDMKEKRFSGINNANEMEGIKSAKNNATYGISVTTTTTSATAPAELLNTQSSSLSTQPEDLPPPILERREVSTFNDSEANRRDSVVLKDLFADASPGRHNRWHISNVFKFTRLSALSSASAHGQGALWDTPYASSKPTSLTRFTLFSIFDGHTTRNECRRLLMNMYPNVRVALDDGGCNGLGVMKCRVVRGSGNANDGSHNGSIVENGRATGRRTGSKFSALSSGISSLSGRRSSLKRSGREAVTHRISEDGEKLKSEQEGPNLSSPLALPKTQAEATHSIKHIYDPPYKPVKFRIEVHHASAGQASIYGHLIALLFIHERGSMKSFREIHKHLLQDWKLHEAGSKPSNAVLPALSPSQVFGFRKEEDGIKDDSAYDSTMITGLPATTYNPPPTIPIMQQDLALLPAITPATVGHGGGSIKYQKYDYGYAPYFKKSNDILEEEFELEEDEEEGWEKLKKLNSRDTCDQEAHEKKDSEEEPEADFVILDPDLNFDEEEAMMKLNALVGEAMFRGMSLPTNASTYRDGREREQARRSENAGKDGTYSLKGPKGGIGLGQGLRAKIEAGRRPRYKMKHGREREQEEKGKGQINETIAVTQIQTAESVNARSSLKGRGLGLAGRFLEVF